MRTDVARWIEEVGITPSDLAEKLGLPRSQVSRLIVGEEEPDRLTEWALAGLRVALLQGARPASLSATKRAPKNPLAQELSDDTWTGKTARLALPVLIDIAKSGKRSTITYTKLHERVVERGGQADMGKMTKYAFPLGRIATAMQRLELPSLTSIVVTRSTGLPSSGIDGFIVHHLDLDRKTAKALSEDYDIRRELVAKIWDEVFAYKDWPTVMTRLGLTGDPRYDA
jgi:hypothetical protein